MKVRRRCNPWSVEFGGLIQVLEVGVATGTGLREVRTGEIVAGHGLGHLVVQIRVAVVVVTAPGRRYALAGDEMLGTEEKECSG